MSRSLSFLLALTGALVTSSVLAAEPSQAELLSHARVLQDQAQATALARVRGGDIRSAELEREHGKLVWSFDIAQPHAASITEVQVDAISGKVVSVKRESASQEAAEAKAEARGK